MIYTRSMENDSVMPPGICVLILCWNEIISPSKPAKECERNNREGKHMLVT